MIGTLGSLVVLQVARHAIGADIGVVAVGMALQARGGRVRSGEREPGQVVVEFGSGPGCGVVADGAIVRDSRGYVIGVGGLGKVGQMATGAVGLDALEAIASVAGVAGQILVRAGQSEMGEAGVIEARNPPAVSGVAGFAGGREAGGAVVDNAVLLKISGMATDALSAESDIASDGCAHVAGIARQRRVRAEKRKTVPMVLKGAGVHAPAEHRVAALALGAELALVEIRVTIGATGPSLGKDFRHVARITGDILVHATKLEAGFGIVIKFGLRAKGGPARGSVTILTWKRKLPVRVGHVDLRYGG